MGINCREKNLASFAKFSSRGHLFSDLLRHLLLATFHFFEKNVYFLFFYFFPIISKCPLLKYDRGPGIKLQDFCSFKCIF